MRAGVESTSRPARRAELAVRRIEERRWRVLGMPAAHYSLLVSIDAEPGSSGAQPARRLGVTPQAVASLVQRLQKQGDLERRRHPRHPLVLEVYPTAVGRGALQRADALLPQIDQSSTDALGEVDSVQLQGLSNRVTALAGDLPGGAW